MPKLFMVYLGGRTPKSNIELHDVRFVVGDKIEDTYDILREGWFGSPRGVHMDSYMQVRTIDGLKVHLKTNPSVGPERLYFVNIGGYTPHHFAEHHQFGLFVANTPEKAKNIAKKQLLVESEKQHKDDIIDVQDALALLENNLFYIHLEPGGSSQKCIPDWYGYREIG